MSLVQVVQHFISQFLLETWLHFCRPVLQLSPWYLGEEKKKEAEPGQNVAVCHAADKNFQNVTTKILHSQISKLSSYFMV